MRLHLFVFLLLLVSSCELRAAEAGHVKPGGKVPDLAFTDLNGAAAPLAALLKDAAGKPRPLLLVVWCSSCPSCRLAEERIAACAEKFKTRAAICFLDANVGETAEKIKAALDKKKLQVSVLVDAAGRSVEVFGLNCTTTALLVDASGVLRYRGRFDQGEEKYAEDALTAVLDGREVKTSVTAEAGCGIVRDASAKPHGHGHDHRGEPEAKKE